MATLLPTTSKDLAALISSKLSINPLLLSLFALSPADTMDYLGAVNVAGWLNLRRATSVADRAQVEHVLAALKAGRTELDSEQQITTAQAGLSSSGVIELVPVQAVLPLDPVLASDSEQQPVRPAPDIALSVARTTLQYALRRYAEHQFIGHSFRIAPQPWLDVDARGVALAIELATGTARIVARFDATFTGSAGIAGRRTTLFTKRSPIEIDLSAIFSVNPAGQLCVGVGPGRIHVPGLPLPASFIESLYQHVREALSAVPIVYLPTRFDLPEASGVFSDEMQVQLSHVLVTEQALTLEFQLFFGPSANPM